MFLFVTRTQFLKGDIVIGYSDKGEEGLLEDKIMITNKLQMYFFPVTAGDKCFPT